MLKIILVSFLFYLYYFVDSYSTSNYGPFDLALKNITICKGPKRRDCCINTGRVINESFLEYNIDVKENITNIHGYVYAISQNKQNVMLQVKKMCNHPFWRPLVENLLQFRNCQILKGNYHMILNVQELSHKYYGGSFIYGERTFKTIMYSTDCNFSCSTVDIVFTPRHKKT